MESRLELEMLAQPDDTTCGPTCLHSVYRYYGLEASLGKVVDEIVPLETGGTIAVTLACHALRRGFSAVIYSYNVQLFDPTWFEDPSRLPERLRAQMKAKSDPVRYRSLHASTKAYLEFLELGGEVRSRDLTPALLREYLKRGQPILTGLSATYLYECAREKDDDYDDIAGEPMGHFVVLCGYDPVERQVLVADPLHDNPGFGSHRYAVSIDRLIGAILLGIVTWDAVLLVIRPRAERKT